MIFSSSRTLFCSHNISLSLSLSLSLSSFFFFSLDFIFSPNPSSLLRVIWRLDVSGRMFQLLKSLVKCVSSTGISFAILGSMSWHFMVRPRLGTVTHLIYWQSWRDSWMLPSGSARRYSMTRPIERGKEAWKEWESERNMERISLLISQVIMLSTPKLRAKMVSHCIELAATLHKFHDYAGNSPFVGKGK